MNLFTSLPGGCKPVGIKDFGIECVAWAIAGAPHHIAANEDTIDGSDPTSSKSKPKFKPTLIKRK